MSATPNQPGPAADPRTEAYKRRLVAEAPLPTTEQRDRLLRLLRPVPAETRRITPGEARPAA